MAQCGTGLNVNAGIFVCSTPAARPTHAHGMSTPACCVNGHLPIRGDTVLWLGGWQEICASVSAVEHVHAMCEWQAAAPSFTHAEQTRGLALVCFTSIES